MNKEKNEKSWSGRIKQRPDHWGLCKPGLKNKKKKKKKIIEIGDKGRRRGGREKGRRANGKREGESSGE